MAFQRKQEPKFTMWMSSIDDAVLEINAGRDRLPGVSRDKLDGCYNDIAEIVSNCPDMALAALILVLYDSIPECM